MKFLCSFEILENFDVQSGYLRDKCGFYALAPDDGWLLYVIVGLNLSNMVWQRGFSMKKIAIALIACITAASLAGCVGKGPWVGKGKGKAPPPAVVTKG